jgi:hypothetical protein
MANVETPTFGVPVVDRDSLVQLWAGAAKRGRGELVAPELADGSVELGTFAEASRASHRAHRVTAGRVSPVVPTDGDFGAWRNETKPHWQVQIDRLWRKVHREYDVSVEILRSPGDLAAELLAGEAVEASGWKGTQGTALASNRRTERLYREIAEGFHATGDLRFCWLNVDGRPVAFDLLLVHADRAWLMKTGYDPRARAVAPGLLLHYALIERCFADPQLDALELLGEADEWKAKFATAQRAHRTFASAPIVSPAAVRYGLRNLARAAKRRLLRPNAAVPLRVWNAVR